MIECVRVKNIAEGLLCLRRYVKSKEEKGERTLVFAEDRLTLLAERALCEESGGSMLTDVTTFSRYLKRGTERVLSKQGSVMKTGEILLALKKNLVCFNKDYSAKTAARGVYETIAQLAACSILPETLASCDAGDNALNRKIADIAAVYGAYRDFLSSSGYADENTMLSLFPAALYADSAIRQSNVVFFAFSSFTAQGKEGLRAAMDAAGNVLGVFAGGEEEFYTLESENAFRDAAKDYGGTKRYRFPTSYSETRRVLSCSLFDAETFRRGKFYTDDVRVYPCLDTAEEAACAAALIKKHVAAGLRYRDIAVFVPDAADYYPRLKQVFGEYRIPLFADVKKPLAEHPLSKFLLALFRAADERLSASAVDDVLASPFFGESGAYRNYLAKYAAYRGGAKRPLKGKETLEKDGYDGEVLAAAQERLLGFMQEIPPKSTGKGYCLAIRRVLAAAGAEDVLKEMADVQEDVALKSYLTRISAATERLLREIEDVSGGIAFTAGDFGDILFDGLTAAEISLVPLKADAVFVGDLASSKVGESKVVIALGMTDRTPAYSEDVALISDRDILKLQGKNIDVAPLISQVNLRVRESVCLNLLSFTQKLYLLYPLSSDGEERGKSEIIGYVVRAFDFPAEDREKELFCFRASERVPAEREFYRRRALLKSHRTKDASAYNALAALLFADSSPFGEKEEKADISYGRQLFFGADGKKGLSPTLVENFNACPYRNFMERGLKVEEREEGLIQAKDSGTFVHEMLRRVGRKIRAGDIDSPERCAQEAEQAGRELLSLPEYCAMADTRADKYYAERLVSDGVSIARAMYGQLQEGDFAIFDAERSFLIPDLQMRGQIDRIDADDEYMRIVDYKTGHIDITLPSYYTGTKVQLELYMRSAARLVNKQPAGLFYFPAAVDFAAPDEEYPPFALKGFVSAEKEIRDRNGEILGKTTKVPQESFPDFLDYAAILAKRTRKRLEQGVIRPAPVDKTCEYCKFQGLCGYEGEGIKTGSLTAQDIVNIVKNEKEGL